MMINKVRSFLAFGSTLVCCFILSKHKHMTTTKCTTVAIKYYFVAKILKFTWCFPQKLVILWR